MIDATELAIAWDEGRQAALDGATDTSPYGEPGGDIPTGDAEVISALAWAWAEGHQAALNEPNPYRDDLFIACPQPALG